MRSADLITVDPQAMVHPLRLTLTDEEMAEIFRGIENDEDWMSLEEISAAMDLLFDHIVEKKQTHPGEIILQ